jgi:hypothetical protein
VRPSSQTSKERLGQPSIPGMVLQMVDEDYWIHPNPLVAGEELL